MTNQWNEGYFTATNYLSLYQAEISPVIQRYSALTHGFDSLAENQNSHHCELGFGQGVSLAIHAASQPGTFWGTDFTPAQVASANTLVEASGSGAHLFDDSFEQFLERPDLPQFDTISLHGIWSWISDKNRQTIIEFSRRYLKPGGLFYVSYNALPGQLSTHPIRHIMLSYHRLATPAAQPVAEQINSAFQFFNDLLAAKPHYAQVQADTQKRFEFISKLDRQYLAHEYFNANWKPFYFSEVAEALSEAKLDFIGDMESGKLSISPEAQAFLATIEHDIMYQQVSDYFNNRIFRKDIFVRGRRNLSVSEQFIRLFENRFCLLTPLHKITAANKASSQEDNDLKTCIQDVASVLAADHYAAKTLNEIAAHCDQHNSDQLLSAMIALVNCGQASACQSKAANEQVRERTTALNAHLINLAHFENHSINVLASPVTGGGIHVGRNGQLFLAALAAGHKNAPDLARFCWNIFHAQGALMTRNGQTTQDETAILAELQKEAEAFLQDDLALLTALQIF